MTRVNAFDTKRLSGTLNPLNALLPERSDDLGSPSYAWATVVQVTPSIAIQLDTETSPIGAPASTLVPVEVNDRVYVQFYQRRMLILGSKLSASSPGENGVYTDWTPTMRIGNGTGVQPIWGNSVRQGRYTKNGDTVDFHGSIQIGSTFNAGTSTGTWSMPLPVPARLLTQSVVTLYARCGSWLGSDEQNGFAKIESADYLLRLWVQQSGAAPQLIQGSRGWAANDLIIVSGTYEAA